MLIKIIITIIIIIIVTIIIIIIHLSASDGRSQTKSTLCWEGGDFIQMVNCIIIYLSVIASIPQNIGCVQYSRRTSLLNCFIVWPKFFVALHNDSVARQSSYVARQVCFVANTVDGTATFIFTYKS